MEIFRAIIELVDKLVWPTTILVSFFFLRNSLNNVINAFAFILKEREGEIKTPYVKMKLSAPHFEEKDKQIEEVK